MKKLKVLIANSDDMAKHNDKISKTGKYYPPYTTKLTVGKRHLCVECKLYHLKKDMFQKDVCKECKTDLLKAGYHLCTEKCGTFLFPEEKQTTCFICTRILKLKTVTK